MINMEYKKGNILDNKYEIIKKLNSGGFGSVYVANDKIANRKVAIKILDKIDDETQENMIHEIRHISSYIPSIITFHHHFYAENHLFMVMEYCEGGSLRDKLNRQKKFKINETTELAIKLTEIFSVIHKENIVHHDIKPDNILFTKEDEIKIGDFGVANKNIGTYIYMPPEMSLSEYVSENDERIDIYSLGITLLELLIGENPLRNYSRYDMLSKKIELSYIPKNIPDWLQDIFYKALNPIPERRFQTMDDFREAILSKNIPHIQNTKLIKAHLHTTKAERLLNKKRWRSAKKYIDYALSLAPDCIPALLLEGRYNLRLRRTEKALDIFNNILRLNPRVDIQKELGQIYLEKGNYSYAISMLNDYIYRNASDFESHNLLMKCFYKTKRFEAAIEIADMILGFYKYWDCFINNKLICEVLLNFNTELKTDLFHNYIIDNPFIEHNYRVVSEEPICYEEGNMESLMGKFLFQEYTFGYTEYSDDTNTIELHCNKKDVFSFNKSIISFGRNDTNDIFLENNNISRIHWAIVNLKNEKWLYDLNSKIGVFVNNKKVNDKIFLNNADEISVQNHKFIIRNSNTLL